MENHSEISIKFNNKRRYLRSALRKPNYEWIKSIEIAIVFQLLRAASIAFRSEFEQTCHECCIEPRNFSFAIGCDFCGSFNA